MARSLPQLAHRRHAFAPFVAVWLGASAWGAQAAQPCAPVTSEPVAVADFRSDGAFLLVDGRAVILSDLVLPPPPWRAAALAEMARLAGRATALEIRLRRPDRHGRLAGQLYGEDGPVALALIRRGLAWAYPDEASPCPEAFLEAEAQARRERVGFWADAAFAPLPAGAPRAILAKRGEFVIVEGTLLSLGERPRRTYLNFGTFWNEDFTAYMDTDAAPRIAKGESLRDLVGRRVRIRGYVLDDRGPAIAVTRPTQLEILEPR